VHETLEKITRIRVDKETPWYFLRKICVKEEVRGYRVKLHQVT